jgi:spore germination cell wall hydrolase CwlJ-like protein
MVTKKKSINTQNVLKTLYIIWMAGMILFILLLLTKERQTLPEYSDDVTNPRYLPISDDEREQRCLEEVMWYEARGEGLQGMKAVANVVLNRVNSEIYPKSICDVVDQPRQFSYRNHLKPSQRIEINPSPSEYDVYAEMQSHIRRWRTEGFEPILEHNVLWYANSKVSNYWTKTKTKIKQIGKHVFYTKKSKDK